MMINDNPKTSGILMSSVGEDRSQASVVVMQEPERTFILTNDASRSPKTGDWLGIIMRLQKYGKENIKYRVQSLKN